MNQPVTIACFVAALGVIFGAFGAHAFAERLEMLETASIYQTATLYHLVHGVAMVLAGVLARQGHRRAAAAAWLFLLGILVFCGSLYTLALSGTKWWGAVTPIGGVAFIVGWIVLGFATARRES